MFYFFNSFLSRGTVRKIEYTFLFGQWGRRLPGVYFET